jgi:hypothetical protein
MYKSTYTFSAFLLARLYRAKYDARRGEIGVAISSDDAAATLSLMEA